MRFLPFLIVALCASILGGCVRAPAEAMKKVPLEDVVVVLDPGHGGEDPGARWTDTWATDNPPEYFEAAYTYRIAAEMKERLEREGATVLLTAKSRTLDPQTWDDAGGPLPVPRDAVSAYAGVPITASRDDRGLGQRTLFAKRVWEQRADRSDRAKTTVFIALHIDSRSPGSSGGHVCIDKRRPEPALGRSIQRAMVAHGTDLWQDGQPMMALDRRELWVLNPANNPIPESVLVELATPSGSIADHDRLLSEKGRRAWVEMLVTALLSWRAETG